MTAHDHILPGMGGNPADKLRDIIEEAKDYTGLPMSELTVLAAQRDPYRLSTASHQANAEWLAECIARIGQTTPIHLRGLHYRLVGSVNLPDGTQYTNTDENWKFLSEKAAMAARFLGTVDFNLITDNRNDAPKIWTPGDKGLTPLIEAGFDFEIPDAEDLTPKPVLRGTFSRQPWRLAIVGEKSGLFDLIQPEAERYQATLALPNGEISTTMTEELIAAADADDRPLAVMYLADCDPAGWQMAVSFARKAQAIIDIRYPYTRLRVHPIALTPEQSRDWDLPSTPLKATEKRADRWVSAMGVEQTEIDAAIARAPDELVNVVRTACRQYFDPALWQQGTAMRRKWEAEATEAFESQMGEGTLDAIRNRVAEKLEQVEELTQQINEETAIDPAELGVKLPPAPEPVWGDREGDALPYLIDTDDGYEECTAALRDRKNY